MSITVIVEFSPKPECTNTRKQLDLPLKCETYLQATILNQPARLAWGCYHPAPPPRLYRLGLGLNRQLIADLKPHVITCRLLAKTRQLCRFFLRFVLGVQASGTPERFCHVHLGLPLHSHH